MLNAAIVSTTNTQNQMHISKVAVIAGNMELAEMIQSYKSEDIGE